MMIGQDLLEIVETAAECGFKPPMTTYYKPDCRGSEYGVWEMSICDSDNIKVRKRKRPDGALDYTIVFRSREDFREWAKEQS